MHAAALSLLGFLLAPSLRCHTVWTLPTGADPTPYIAQAAAGDVLVLNVGHPAFHLDKGLVLLGTGTTAITGDLYFGPSHCTFAIPDGQQAHVVGLTFQRIVQPYTSIGHSVLVSAGAITFENCRFLNDGGNYALRVDAGEVVLQDCLCRSTASTYSGPPGVGLWIDGGTVAAANTRIEGAPGHFDVFVSVGFAGKPALNMTGGQFVGTGIELIGGRTASDGTVGGGVVPQPAVTQLGGVLRLIDSTATGGSGFYPQQQVARAGAPAIVSTGGTCLAARTAVVGGAGSPPGAASTGVIVDDAMIGMVASSAPQLGQSFDGVATAGSSQQLLAIAGGFAIAANAPTAALLEPLWLEPAGATILALAVPAPGATVPTTVAVPNTQTLLGNTVWLQAVQLQGSSWRLSNVVGGVMR